MSTDKAKIKLVIGINDFLVGGAQKLIADVLQRFDAETFECNLVVLQEFPGRDTFYELVPSWVRVHVIDFRSFYHVRAWIRLYRLLRQLHPDVVWTHMFYSNTIFRVLKPLCGYRVVATEHNTYTWKNGLHRAVDRLLAAVTYRIVAVSETVASFTAKQESIHKEKFAVIHNGVAIDQIARAAAATDPRDVKSDLGIGEEQRIVLNVGRLLPQKNQALLIDAFARFHTTHPEYVLVILGDGPLRDRLRARAHERGIGNMVLLPGTKKDVARYYAASDFFVLSSAIEGFGIVGIEAMACGLPVISTKTAGPDEYIHPGKNGFLADATPEDVFIQMEKVAALTTEERDVFAAHARDVAKIYSIDRAAESYASLIAEAAS